MEDTDLIEEVWGRWILYGFSQSFKWKRRQYLCVCCMEKVSEWYNKSTQSELTLRPRIYSKS